jgi:arsenate reductase-like glutaredoxin family protein
MITIYHNPACGTLAHSAGATLGAVEFNGVLPKSLQAAALNR